MEEKHTHSHDFLESQLAQVVEQDGVVLNTPHGVRRKKKVESRKSKVASTHDSRLTTHDDVASLDRDVVNLMIAGRGGVERSVPIRQTKHARSPYVVSLQNVVFSRAASRRVEHVPATHAIGGASFAVSTVPFDAYAAHEADLFAETDPWSVAEQFTPGTFEESYRAVYGRFDRITSAVREITSVAIGFFHRVEEVEAQAVEDMKSVMGVTVVPRFSYARALAAFAGLALVVTLPANAIALYRSASTTKSAASAAGDAAVADLLAAKDAKTLPESADALRKASAQFRSLDAMLTNAHALATGAASLVSGKVRTVRALAEVGADSSDAARLIALGLDKVFADPGRRLDERLDVLGAYSRSALTLLGNATRAAATVDPSALPESERGRVTSLLQTLGSSTDAVREFAVLSDALSVMSGRDSLRKYLFIFQNQTELRPTGGFMGSFAEVTMDRGAVTSVRVPGGGTYDLKGQLLARVTPPAALGLVTNRWQFQDANWFPDFPTSAKKIRWFWDKSRQSTVDGIVAVNASLVERLLAITGPIDLPAYGKTIDASNFLLETQKAVELDYDKAANTPKKFIGDLATALLDRLKNLPKDKWLAVAGLVSDALDRKDVQVALFKPEEAELANRYGWNGSFKDGIGDELALIEANVAGQKTDGVISEAVNHAVAIAKDGTITDTVMLTRTHNGKKGELFRGVRNVTYLRAYVPKGSELISASGFNAPDKSLFKAPDTTTSPDPDVAMSERAAGEAMRGVTVAVEGSRTTFGGWLQLDPGATQTVTLSYRLPFTVSDISRALDTGPDASQNPPSGRGAYLLHFVSQSGRTRALTTSISAPPGWSLAWKRPDEVAASGANVRYGAEWDRDRTIALLFAPHDDTNTQTAR